MVDRKRGVEPGERAGHRQTAEVERWHAGEGAAELPDRGTGGADQHGRAGRRRGQAHLVISATAMRAEDGQPAVKP